MVSWLTSAPSAKERAQKEADAHREELKKEIERAIKGDLDTLRARRDTLEAERAELLQDGLQAARARTAADPIDHGRDFPEAQRRSDNIIAILGAVNNRIRALTDERAEALAATWSAGAGGRAVNDYLAARAASLAAVAALVASHEAAIRDGSTSDRLFPLPVADVTELKLFAAYVDTLRARGVKVDVSNWPQSVRERIAR